MQLLELFQGTLTTQSFGLRAHTLEIRPEEHDETPEYLTII